MTQNLLTTWFANQPFNFPDDKLEKLNCAFDLCKNISPDLVVNQDCLSTSHLIELIKILVELQADEEVLAAAFLFHILRSGQEINDQCNC